MNCWKVKIKTTNSSGNNGYGPVKNGKTEYIDCDNGYLYVFCDSPSEVEKVVKADTVLSIELMGLGYIAE